MTAHRFSVNWTQHRSRHEKYTPHSWATIETYTVMFGRRTNVGIIIGRLESGNARFIAQVATEDLELLTVLETGREPIGQRVFVTARGYGNRVTLDSKAAELFPVVTPVLRDDYKFVKVSRNGHLLEVTMNRPEARNALHPPAHEELAEIFDAYFADRELWVAIITGAGETSFCAGNNLVYSNTGEPVYIPLAGFGGLTHRPNMHKPVIAAVNGFAMGGGWRSRWRVT